VSVVLSAARVLTGASITPRGVVTLLPPLAVLSAFGFGWDIADIGLRASLLRSFAFALAAMLLTELLMHLIAWRAIHGLQNGLLLSSEDFYLAALLVFLCIGAPMISRYSVRKDNANPEIDENSN